MRSIDRPALERLPLRLLALVTVLVLVGGVQALAATIHTDLWLYQKGDTVQVFGEDFGPSETVDVVTTSPTGAPVDAGTAQTDAVGAFGYAFVLDSDESGIFDVTATGRDSGFTATTQFDPAHASLSPGSKAFGSVDVGSSSSAQTFTISNTGTTVLNVQGVVLSGGNADQFTLNTTGMSTSVAAGTSTTFSVTFTPTSAGAKSASVNVTTNAEDPSAPLTGTGVATDSTPPTVSMSSAASDPTATSPIPVTVAFSESVTGFVAGDVAASNGSVSNFAGSGASYTFDLVPAAAGTVTANIAAGVASDGAGNPNTAATQFSRTYAPNTAPTISDVANQTIVEDGTTGALAVSVGDAQTAAGSLTLTGSSSDTTLVPNANITFGGSGASRTVSVVPAANRTGSATITLTVSDGSLTASDTFTVTVTAVNDAPVCQDVAISTGEDTPGSVAPDCSDVDGDSLSYTVGGASEGTSGFSAGALTYEPDANFSGSDGFTYTADDGNGGSDTANVDVTVSAANDDPVCQDVVITTAEDGSGSIAPDCSDADGDALTYTVSAAADGTSGFSAGNLTYDPNANLNGSDGFTYTADDGHGGTDTANVEVTVTPVNDDPVCQDVAISTAEDDAGSTAPNCFDVDGDSLTYSVGNASDGTSGTSTGDLTYDPDLDFNGSDGFTYTADDGNGGSDTANVDVTVTAVNDDPVCRDVSITTAEDAPGSVAPDCSDVDGDSLSYTVGGASEGTSGFSAGALTYDPDANFSGSDGFTYTADDGNGGTDTANVDVAVSAENDDPVCQDVVITTAEDGSGSIAPDCSDADGDSLTYSVGSASDGTSGTSAGDLTYDPDLDFNGSDGFTYTADDGNGGSDTANVDVTVTAVNDDPVCHDVSITTAEDTAGSTAPDCSDVEGDPLTYSVGPASDGTSGFVLVLITYEPDANFSGSDGFTYTADDGNGGTDTANVDVAVSAENDAPSATDDAATTAQDTAVTGIDVLGNDTDVDGDTLSVTAFDATSVEGGTASCASDCSYTPPSGFSGSDSFGYTVGDGNGGSDTAIVTITVSAVASNEPPTITILPAAQVVQYSDPIRRVTVFGDDAETPGSGLTFRASGMPEGVTFTDGGGGRAVLEGVADDAPGIYRVTVTVTDADGGRASATTVITIAPEDAIVHYTGDHLVFTEPGSHGGEVNLSATISDLSAAGAAFRVPVLRAATSSDATAGDVSGASVTFMSGETVLCGPVPVAIGDPTDPTFGTAACDEPVALPLGSHDVDVHVSGAYRFSATVGQVEVDRATRNYVAGGGFMTATSSAGDVPATDGSRVSFGFRVRFSPRLTNVRGHANVLFVSDGATYQVRAHDIDSIELGPRAGTASFVTHASLSDVTDPLDPVMLGSDLRLVVWTTDAGSRDRIAVAAYRGGTLIFASGWNGAPVKAALGGGAIVLR